MREKGKSTSGPWCINGTDSLSIALQGTPNQIISISLLAVKNESVYAEVSVDLVYCAFGFEFSEITRQCICNEKLVTRRIYCEVKSGSITIPPYLWFGPVQLNSGTAT